MKEDYKKHFNPAYIGYREDILNLIPNGKNIIRILDIGCSIGTLGEQIKQRNKNVEVVGIEFDEQMAKIAKEKLDKVIEGDVEKINLGNYFTVNYFDCIILADILEHLKNPWDVLKNITTFLNDDGIIIASIPNIRHNSTILSLVIKGYWPYRERGIHDKTHLRFFTLHNIKELFQYGGLNIVEIKRIYRIIESPHPLNTFARYFALPLIRDFLTFQYLIVAKKKRG